MLLSVLVSIVAGFKWPLYTWGICRKQCKITSSPIFISLISASLLTVQSPKAANALPPQPVKCCSNNKLARLFGNVFCGSYSSAYFSTSTTSFSTSIVLHTRGEERLFKCVLFGDNAFWPYHSYIKLMLMPKPPFPLLFLHTKAGMFKLFHKEPCGCSFHSKQAGAHQV